MLNLNDVQLFVRVVEHGGFAPAGRHLNVPKSTLSKRVAELEQRLGVRLIQRTSRTFVLTEVGRDFHRHAAAMLIEAESAENIVRSRLVEPSGSVRITCSVPTAQYSLARLLPEIASTWPRIHVVLHAADRFVDLVREGFDIGIRDHFAPLPDSDLVQRRVGFSPNWLVASPAYLDRCGTPSQPEELARHQGLLTSPTAVCWRLQDETGPERTCEAHPVPRLSADESSVLLAAAEAGLGIACLPRSICAERIEAGGLVRVLRGWTAGGVTTTLLMPHRRGQLPSVRVVADFLVDRLAED